jgi:hypothetical protein
VGEKLKVDKLLTTEKHGHSLLDYACRPKRKSTILAQLEQDNDLDPQMVKLLLEHGSDPNQLMGWYSYEKDTVWTLFILDCYCTSVRPGKSGKAFADRSSLNRYHEVIELVIDHGASPNGIVQIFMSNDTPLPARRAAGVERQGRVERPFEAVEGDGTEVSIHAALQHIFGDHRAARLALRMEAHQALQTEALRTEEVAHRNRPRASYFWRLLGR